MSQRQGNTVRLIGSLPSSHPKAVPLGDAINQFRRNTAAVVALGLLSTLIKRWEGYFSFSSPLGYLVGLVGRIWYWSKCCLTATKNSWMQCRLSMPAIGALSLPVYYPMLSVLSWLPKPLPFSTISLQKPI